MKATRISWTKDHARSYFDKRHLVAEVLYMGGNICGGYPRFMSSPNADRSWSDYCEDIDLFPSSDKNKADLTNYLLSNGFSLNKMSVAASTFVKGESDLNVQIVNVTCPNPELIISDFDIEVCKFFFSAPDVINGTEQAFKDNENFVINISGGWEDPILLAYRVGKYVSKGFTLNALDSIRLNTLLEGQLDTDIRAEEIKDKQHFILQASQSFNTDNSFSDASRDAYKNFIKRFAKRMIDLQEKYKNTMI